MRLCRPSAAHPGRAAGEIVAGDDVSLTEAMRLHGARPIAATVAKAGRPASVAGSQAAGAVPDLPDCGESGRGRQEAR